MYRRKILLVPREQHGRLPGNMEARVQEARGRKLVGNGYASWVHHHATQLASYAGHGILTSKEGLPVPVLFLILLSVFLGAGAQVLFKIGVLQLGSPRFDWAGMVSLALNPAILAGLVAFAASFLLWLKILATVPLSYAYPMVSLGYVFIFLVSWLFLGESLPAPRVLGLVLIIAGIFFIARS